MHPLSCLGTEPLRCDGCRSNGDEHTYRSPTKDMTNAEIAFSETPDPPKDKVMLSEAGVVPKPVARKLQLASSDSDDGEAVPVKINTLNKIGTLLNNVIRQYSLDKEWKELQKHWTAGDPSGSSYDLKPQYELEDDIKHNPKGTSAVQPDITIRVFPQIPSSITIPMKTLEPFGFDVAAYVDEVEQVVSTERREKYVALVTDPVTKLQFNRNERSRYTLIKGSTADSFPSYPLLVFCGQNQAEFPHFDCSGEGAITTIGHPINQPGNWNIAAS